MNNIKPAHKIKEVIKKYGRPHMSCLTESALILEIPLSGKYDKTNII